MGRKHGQREQTGKSMGRFAGEEGILRQTREIASRLQGFLGLGTFPVAVFLLRDREEPFARWTKAHGHRYCQGIMRARRGSSCVSNRTTCPARPPPGRSASGRCLVGFGIAREPETGRAMFEGMRYLEMGALAGVALCPLHASPRQPDVVIVEGTPEQLMWLLLADLNLAGGARRHGSTAVLQATCVDATDLAPTETVIGFPGRMLEALAEEVGFLSGKAIPQSREKRAWKQLERK